MCTRAACFWTGRKATLVRPPHEPRSRCRTFLCSAAGRRAHSVCEHQITLHRCRSSIVLHGTFNYAKLSSWKGLIIIFAESCLGTYLRSFHLTYHPPILFNQFNTNSDDHFGKHILALDKTAGSKTICHVYFVGSILLFKFYVLF